MEGLKRLRKKTISEDDGVRRSTLVDEEIPRQTTEIQPEDQCVGEFEVVKYIGSGGICDVHLVKELGTNKIFAYKSLNREHFDEASRINPEAPQHLKKLLKEEARLMEKMGKLDAAHFPSFVIDKTLDDLPGILTEYVPESLEEKVGKLKTQKALDYFEQIASAINLLHEKGEVICMGDIKPSNFRIDDEDHVKIIDLNLKYTDPKTLQGSVDNSLAFSLIGGSGKLKGTLGYMAPEQLMGQADQRTDVYQLSALGYELLTGVKPMGIFEDLEEIKPEVAELGEVFRRGMARDPTKRQSSVEQLLNDFNKVVNAKFNESKKPVARLETMVANSEEDYATSIEASLENPYPSGVSQKDTTSDSYKDSNARSSVKFHSTVDLFRDAQKSSGYVLN